MNILKVVANNISSKMEASETKRTLQTPRTLLKKYFVLPKWIKAGRSWLSVQSLD